MRRRRVLVEVGLPLLVFVALVGVWYLISYVVLSPDRRFLLPPPHQVINVGLFDSTNRSVELAGLWSTTEVALTGLVIAAALGMSFAILMSQARWVERSFYPYAVTLQTIPILALVPLLGYWFGFGFGSRVLVCVLISIFPIITNTLFGIQSVDARLHDVFSLQDASRLLRLRKLELPAALPAILTGLRISAGLSVIGAIVGDFFFRQGPPGIGRLIDVYRGNLQSEQLITAVALSSLLGLCVFWAVGALADVTVGRWYGSKSRGR